MSRPTESRTVPGSTPVWPGMVREQTSTSSSGNSSWKSSSSIETVRAGGSTGITDPQAPVQGYERPLDFLHLFSLVRRVWPQNDELHAYGNLSMSGLDTLGTGMSFKVSLHHVHEAFRDFINERAGYKVGNMMAVKGLRFVDDINNNVAKKCLYSASLREIRALTHQPLRSHPNIITLLGVGWEPDLNHHDVAWPLLFLEYSEEGTLKDYQMGKPGMEFSEKIQLCEDVGRALLAIHGSGIVHGDVKSENILVFWSAEKERMVGKVGDFGSSVLDFREDEHRGLLAHTIPWNAPECDQDIPRVHLKFTDVYSFGMLIFRVMLGGINPFGIAPFKSDEVDMKLRSQELKKDPEFISLVAVVLCEHCDAEEADAVCGVLEFTLQYIPTQRNLEKAVSKLSKLTGNTENIPPVTPLEEFDYEAVDFEANGTNDSFCVRASIIHALEAVASGDSVHAHRASFQLFQLLLNRYGSGIPGDSDMTLLWLSHYADSGGYDEIGHSIGRIFNALGAQLDEEILFQVLLRQGALKGSHTAFEDLKTYYPEAYDETLALFRECGGAMGMLQRSALFPWVNVSSLEGIAEAIENSPGFELGDIHVTEDEDTLLHCAARSGYLEVVKGLISLGIDINATNRLGETPLLEASKAGHYEVSRCLIEAGARADKTSIFGEGPIHFLPFFDEQHIDTISELMVRNGANADKWATENPRAGDHGFWGHSPLHYAVVRNHLPSIRALLRLGADPYAENESISAIRWACLSNRAEALDMMAAASNRRLSSEDSKFEPLVAAVLCPSARLGVVREHGGNHENAKIATLKILHKYKAINYRDMFGRGRCTVLHYAARAGYPRVVNYLLDHTPSKQHIDVFCDDKTPLVDVINRGYRDVFEVLLRHGADIHLTFPGALRHSNYLHVCALAGHRDVFFPEQLLKHGIPVDRVDGKGRTPFGVAVVEGNYPVADLLLQHGADRDYTVKGYTILARCLEIPLPLKSIKYLMTCKSNPERPPPSFICSPGSGKNVFHSIAVAGGTAENTAIETKSIFRYLQELWPGEERINACDRIGATPILSAVMHSKVDLINMMIAAGADLNLSPLRPLYFALGKQNWANEQIKKVGGRWMTRRTKKMADTVVTILKEAGAETDINSPTGLPRAFEGPEVFSGVRAEDIEFGLRIFSEGLKNGETGASGRYAQGLAQKKAWEHYMPFVHGTNQAQRSYPFQLRELDYESSTMAPSDQTAESWGRKQPQNTPPSTPENKQLNWRERGERWKRQLERVSRTAIEGINGIQLPKVGPEASWSRGPEMPISPRIGISQLSSPSNGPPVPTYRPPSREPEVSTNTWRGISQLSPSNSSSPVPTYKPPPRKPESSPSTRRGISQLSPSNTILTGPSYRPPPRHSITSPGRRSPPPSLLDTPIPSSLSSSSSNILSPALRGISQFSPSITSSALRNYRPQSPQPAPAPQPNEPASSLLGSRNIATSSVTRETRLALANPPPPQPSPQSVQTLSPRQGISQLSPSPQPTLQTRHRSTSSSSSSPPFPQHIPWTISHQKPPHEILDSLRPAILPLITALLDYRRSDAIPRRNLKICLENHLCVPNLIDLKWDPATPLGSSSVKELQSGLNKMLRGFSIVINLKLRVEMGGERGTRTVLRVLMDEDGGSTGGDGWLRTEGAGWEDLERIEVGMMFPPEI